MTAYKLEIKQIVDYPRCRIYRDFVRNLVKNKNIRVGNSCGLYYYIVLCSFVNFRSSYKRIKGFLFNIYPGEWILPIRELTGYLRTGSRKKTLAVMDDLQGRLGWNSSTQSAIRQAAKSSLTFTTTAAPKRNKG